MNYMKEVTQMLGVELEEEFSISNTGLIYKFVDNGLLQKHIPIGTWHYDHNALMCLLNGEYEIAKKSILEETEKRYLSNVIKPFRDRVKCILKDENFGKEFICIILEDDEFSLPFFEPNTMYKRMELYKQYSLEDLEL